MFYECEEEKRRSVMARYYSNFNYRRNMREKDKIDIYIYIYKII